MSAALNGGLVKKFGKLSFFLFRSDELTKKLKLSRPKQNEITQLQRQSPRDDVRNKL